MKIFSLPIPLAKDRKSLVRARLLLSAMHLAGIIGLSFAETEALFRLLTPFNLLLSSAILFYFHTDWRPAFWVFVLLTYLTGFFIEVAGVHSGLIFGQYTYGSTLGLKLWAVPLLIGLNWLMLVYSSGLLAATLAKNKLLQAALGASLMVLLDVLIEPVAMKFDFWQWEQNSVPLQNYLAWWLVAFVLQTLLAFLPFRKENPLATFFYVVQLLFFLILFLFIV